MAFSFNGSNQLLSALYTLYPRYPISLYADIYVARKTVIEPIIHIAETSDFGASDDYAAIYHRADRANDPFEFDNRNLTQIVYSSPSTLNAWHSVLGSLSSNAVSGSNIYVNGVLDRSVLASDTLSNVTLYKIWIASAGGAYFSGVLANVGIWSAALNADEAKALAKGFSPRRIRPQSLVFYAPLLRNLHDLRQGLALTAVNAPTVANHPRVY